MDVVDMSVRDEVVAEAAHIVECATRFGLSDVALFGSVARGTQRPDSDIDLVVQPGPRTGLFAMCGFAAEVEELLGTPRRVDVASWRVLDGTPPELVRL